MVELFLQISNLKRNKKEGEGEKDVQANLTSKQLIDHRFFFSIAKLFWQISNLTKQLPQNYIVLANRKGKEGEGEKDEH